MQAGVNLVYQEQATVVEDGDRSCREFKKAQGPRGFFVDAESYVLSRTAVNELHLDIKGARASSVGECVPQADASTSEPLPVVIRLAVPAEILRI